MRREVSKMRAMRVERDPAELGFDAGRLARLDRHFARSVDDGRLASWLAVVAREGRVAHVASAGPCSTDTVWRIYSMTKPITSVAAMLLWEEGAFELTDPVARFVPEMGEARVWAGGSSLKPVTVPQAEPMRVWHLLTHTSGLTYGFHYAHPVDAIYRSNGFEWGFPPGLDLAGCCAAWAEMPLLFQPGAEWNYSVSTDVLGRVVEVASGMSLDAFFAERIFAPLGMTDTGFWARDAARLPPLYTPDPETKLAVENEAFGAAALREPDAWGGGGGLVSTAGDYHRFARMLLNEGELDGVRLLAPRTVRLMASNHLPGGLDLETFGRPLFAETPFTGVGFGLGFSVVLDPVAGRSASSAGEFAWGGAASTAFWVDPAEGVTALFFTQLLPSSTWPIRSELRQLVYQALTGPRTAR
jgi:CubicO group peptidase (beta-lactamase class C family)